MTLRRLFGDATAAEGARVALDPEARKHVKVLRLSPGTPVELFDGEGHLAEAELLEGGGVRIVRSWVAEPALPHTTLVWALPKAPAVELGIRMATELGVDAIRLALGERSPAEPSAKKVERWRRIAREATRQCERPTTPDLLGPRPFAEAARTDAELRLAALARTDATEPVATAAASVAVAIGPEGGFTDAERALLEELGYLPLALGPHVLRSDTAVVAALAGIQRRGAIG